jgi:polysaccharide biosynthesis transport protein
MAQYEMNLRDYWLIIRRRRWTIIGSMILAMLFSFWLAKQKVPTYQATAAVKFEQSTSLSGLLVEVLSYSTSDSIETQASLIKSYPILEEVARRLNRLPQSTRGEALRESKAYTGALDNIAGKIRTQRVPSTSILEIVATSTNPREARELANTVAEVYRDYSKSNRNARITEARKFIESQLKEVEGRVKRAEEEVWAFRDANRVISPGAESTVLLSLFTQVRGDIERTRQHRTELEQVQARLSRTDTASVAERVYIDLPSPGMQKLSATQTDLMLERTNLALEVTDKHPRLQAIDDRLREVRAEMRREVTAQVALLRNREEILGRQMGELMQKNREVPAIELGLQRLQRDAKVNDDLLTLLKTKHQEALIKESEGIEEVTFIRPAAEPAAPVGSETLNTLFIGALLGLMLGLVVAFVQETLDTSIGTIEDVETYLEVPVLGIVPHIDPRETMQRLLERRPGLANMDPDVLQSHALLITHFDPKSPVAEAYRTLRTNIQFQRMERGGKVLVVTSPTLQEGKTTTIVNLALTMAQNGQRTLLVGGNMRRPSIYRFFGIEREPGLSDILVGNAQWRDCVRGVADILMGRFEMEDIMASPGLDNLNIIEAGPIPANPSELLSSPAMGEFLRAVSAEYDIVLIDTPPTLPVTDSAIVAGQADGVLLVYQAGKVGRLVLKRAKAHLEAARAKVWGVVLNDLQTEVSGYTYTHYYTHYYGEETVVPPTGNSGRLQRAWDYVRGGSSPATTAPTAAGPAVGAAIAEDAPPPPRKSGALNLWILVGAVLALSAVAFGIVAWRTGGLGDPLNPKAVLRQRMDTPPPPRPTSPPVPRAQTPGTPAPGAPVATTVPAAPGPPVLTLPTPWALAPLPATPAPGAPVATTVPAAPGPPVLALPTPRASAPLPATPVPAAPVVTVLPATPAPPAAALPVPRAAAPPAATALPAVAPATALPAPRPPAPPAPVAAVTAPPRAPVAAPGWREVVPPAGAAVAAARFAIEFGPFATPAEAERLERRLTQSGYQTVRFRQSEPGAAVYAVLIERMPPGRDAASVVASLREKGVGEATVLGTDPPSVRVGEPVALRGAVELAERVRAAGHQVRVAAQAGEAVTFVIRHGNFLSHEEAEAKGRELSRRSLPGSQVVQVR